jgi:hypothetical protein
MQLGRVDLIAAVILPKGRETARLDSPVDGGLADASVLGGL